jgi:HK97 family phage portal protein
VSLFWRDRGQQQRLNGFTANFSSPPIPPNSGSATAGGVSFAASETSLQTVAMWSAVDLLTSLTSELPVDVYRGSGRDKVSVPTPSYLLDPGGDGYGLEDWIAQLLMSWLLRGNTNGRILGWSPGVTGGFPTQISLYHPDSVAGWYGPDGKPVWRVQGRIFEPVEDMWHRRVHPVSGRLMGLSPVQYQAATLGLSLTATQFGLEWFQGGAHPSGMLTNSEVELTPSLIRSAKDKFLAAVFGSREPLVMGKGWKYEQLQINPEESQFLETNKFSQAQVARIFGPGVAEVLGYESGGSLTYSTVEGRSQHLLVYALNKWLRRVDRVLTQMLPRGTYARLNRSALLEPTVLDRWRVYQLQLGTKARTVNEVRDVEDWAPVPWGDGPVDVPVPDPNAPPPADPNNPAGGAKP